jgi:hypothetical protein
LFLIINKSQYKASVILLYSAIMSILSWSYVMSVICCFVFLVLFVVFFFLGGGVTDGLPDFQTGYPS